MRVVQQYVSALFLTATLLASGPVFAAAAPQDAVQVRIYDSHHHDYHSWDDREDHAYRGYLEQRHETYHPYGTWHSREQRNYWKWRHNHPDHN